MENKNILHDKEIAKLADVLENKTYMTFENPELKEVVFDYGDFGDLTKKDSEGGQGIIHIIQRRAEEDNLSKEQITSLLVKIGELTKTEKPDSYDKSGNRAFINKNGIRVVLQKNWKNKGENWLISGYGLLDENKKVSLEAIETIKAVTASYGYKPELSFLQEQVGAIIASINTIRQKQLAVKKEKENIKVEKGTKQITTQNAMTVYARAVLKERPSFVSDKELITAFAAANYAKNALANGSQSQMLKKTKNRKLIEIAASQTHIDAYENELISRGYTLNVQNTFSETNVNYSRTVRVNVSEGKERIIETLRNESQEQENLRTEPSSSPTDDIQQVSPSVNNETNPLTNDTQNNFSVVSKKEFKFFDSDNISFREYVIKIDRNLFNTILPKEYSNVPLEDNATPCIIWRKPTDEVRKSQFFFSKFESNLTDEDEINNQINRLQTHHEVQIKDEKLLKSLQETIERYKAYEQGHTRTYSVNFNCGFTFPKDIQNHYGKKEEYRWKVFEELKKQYGFNENDTETQYFDDKNSPANDSFNINFAAPVPEEIRDSKISVDKWIEEVETYLEDNYGAYIKWEGGERVEEIVKKENIEPKIEFVFTDPEDISIDERTNMVQMRVFNSDEKYELEKMLDPDFDIENDSISFYYFKDLKTGSEYINWVNHTANPNREGYIGTSDLPQEIKDRIFETIRPVFEKEYDSLSYDKIISGGLKENILTDSKETFLKDTGCSENAYKKVIEEIKKESVEEFKEDFITVISHGNNNLIKELVPSVNSDDKQILASGLFTALENNNTEAWKTILDSEKFPGEIIEHKLSLLHDAAADLNVDLIDDIMNRYERNKELLSKLIFETAGTINGQNALNTAINRWHDIEADFSDKEIPDAITMIATAEDSVTNGSKISVFIDPKTGNYMTVNTLINGYETNIFDKNMNLIAHDTMDGYTNWEGNQKNAESQLEAALVTMQAEQGKNWSNWKKFEIIAGPERIKLGEELLRITKKTFDEMQKKSFENLDAFNKSKTAGEHNNQIDSSSTAKSVTERYLNSVKKILHDEVMENKGWFSDTQPVEKVLIAAQKALSAFSDHEKKEISRFLLSKGARDKDSMENIIKRSISTEKSHKREKTDRPIPER